MVTDIALTFWGRIQADPPLSTLDAWGQDHRTHNSGKGYGPIQAQRRGQPDL